VRSNRGVVGINGRTIPTIANAREIVPAIISKTRVTLFLLGFKARLSQAFWASTCFSLLKPQIAALKTVL
jgi:hypothetical protein